MKTIFLLIATTVSLTVSAQLNPDFSPNHTIETCGPTDVFFVCTAPQGADNIWWDFGDGTTATGLTPIHNYATTGVYDVKMVVEKNGVKDSITKVGFVTIKPAPQAIFKTDTSMVFPRPFERKFIFTGFSNADSISDYAWTVNDIAVEGGAAMYYLFQGDGTYKVSVTVTNNRGCSDEFSDTITISDSPQQPLGIGEKQKEQLFSVSVLYDQSQLLIGRDQSLDDPAKIFVRDISGRLVTTVEMPQGTTLISVPLTGLPNGTYFVECLTKTYSAVKRFSVIML